MSFFGLGPNYNRPGPGIPKDAAQKKGAALFFEILGREFWNLFTLHFVYLLACLPIITIGPATVALSRVTVTMIRDQNVYVWRDFWEAFRKNIKQGLLFGIPATMFVMAAFWMNIGILFGAAAGQSSLPAMVLIFLWTFLGVAVGCYLFPLVAYVGLPSFALLKNALFLMVLGKFRTLAAVLVSIVAASAVALFYPVSFIVLLFAGSFALLSFFTSFMVWPVIAKYVIKEDGAEDETLAVE